MAAELPAETPSPIAASDFITAYCFGCRSKKIMHNAAMTRMANNRWAFTGTCETCGKKLYKISANAAPAA